MSSPPSPLNRLRAATRAASTDRKTEDEELAEYEAAMKLEDMAMMLVPQWLAPEIHARAAVELFLDDNGHGPALR